MNRTASRTRRSCFLTAAMAMGLVTLGAAPAAHAADANRDAIPDSWETRYGLSLSVKQTWRDQDGDGLANLYEYRSGTNPRRGDTDRDGRRDARENADRDRLTNRQEQKTRTHPGKVDTDGDGVPDADEDVDRDGLENDEEFRTSSHPRDADSDDDGLDDGDEDADRDDRDNEDEFDLGTNPRDSDSDDDGKRDGAETAGIILSVEGQQLTLMLTTGATFSAPLSADVEIEADDCDTFRDSDGEGTIADLVPGTVISELEVDEETLEIVEIEIAIGSDYDGDDD